MIQVREAMLPDAQFIIQSQIQMAKETEAITLDESTVFKGVNAVFKNPSRGEYYIALDETGERVGCLLTVPEWSDWRNGTILWIHSVYVIPRARRSGVFRTLYDHLKQKTIHSSDLRGLRLYVERKNENAQRTYESLGMSKEHYELYEWLKA
jgi:ribosomal protein S18 acetylase RimI-like enzyme